VTDRRSLVQYPGHKPGTGHSEPERHDHDGVDEESGLLNGGGSHTSFVSRLTTGIEALTRDQRAAYVCFSCDLVKVGGCGGCVAERVVLLSKCCSRAVLVNGAWLVPLCHVHSSYYVGAR